MFARKLGIFCFFVLLMTGMSTAFADYKDGSYACFPYNRCCPSQGLTQYGRTCSSEYPQQVFGIPAP